MKILITGHKGFIGSYLWDHIKSSGVDGIELDGIDFPDDIGDFKTDKIYDVVDVLGTEVVRVDVVVLRPPERTKLPLA